MKYQIIEATETSSGAIQRTDKDGTIWFIPFDEANPDYQRYLRWLENPDADESGTL